VFWLNEVYYFFHVIERNGLLVWLEGSAPDFVGFLLGLHLMEAKVKLDKDDATGGIHKPSYPFAKDFHLCIVPVFLDLGYFGYCAKSIGFWLTCFEA
jgi:hypothetical protein